MSKSSMLFANAAAARKRAHDAGLETSQGKMELGLYKRYKRILVEQIHEDLELPAHLRSQFDYPLRMICTICDVEEVVQSVADVGDFADAHAHGMAWGCDCLEYNPDFVSVCRWCGADRHGQIADAKVDPSRSVRRYAVRLHGKAVAWVEANSLLRARRAARGMYPGKAVEDLTVSWMGVGEWTATYGRGARQS